MIVFPCGCIFLIPHTRIHLPRRYHSLQGSALVLASDGVVCWLNLLTRKVSCMQAVGARAGADGWTGGPPTTDLPDAYRTVWALGATENPFLPPRSYRSLSGSDYSLCALRSSDNLPECYVTPAIASVFAVPEHSGRAPSAWPIIPSFPLAVIAAAGPVMDEVICLHMLSAEEHLQRASALAAAAIRNATVVTRCYGRQGIVQLALNDDISMPMAAPSYAGSSWTMVTGYRDVCQTAPPSFAAGSSAACWGATTAAGISAGVTNRHAAAGDGFMCVTSTATATSGQVICYNAGAPGTTAISSAVQSFLAPNMSYPVLTIVNRTNTTWFLWTNYTNVTSWANVTVENFIPNNSSNSSDGSLSNFTNYTSYNTTTLVRTVNMTSAIINQTVSQIIRVPINVTYYARPGMGQICASRAFVCGLGAPSASNASLMAANATLSCAGTGPEIAYMAASLPLELANATVRNVLPVSNPSGTSYFTIEMKFSDLSCGGSFVCARRRNDSSLFCLGNESVAASGSLDWSDVGPVARYCTGREHVCVLDAAGVATCRGDPSSPGVSFATTWATHRFTHIVCARDSTCGVNSSGYVLCSSADSTLAMADGQIDVRESITSPGVYIDPPVVAARSFIVDPLLAANDTACRPGQRGDTPAAGGVLLCRTLESALQAAVMLSASITIRGRVNVTAPISISPRLAGLTITGVAHPVTSEAAALVFWPSAGQSGASYDVLNINADVVTIQSLSIEGGPAVETSSSAAALLCNSAVAVQRRYFRLSSVSFVNLACSAEIVRAAVPATLRPAWSSSAESIPDLAFSNIAFGGYARRSSPYPLAIDSIVGSPSVFSCAGIISSDGYLSISIDGLVGVVAWPAQPLLNLPCTDAAVSPAVGLVAVKIDSRSRMYGFTSLQRTELLSTVPEVSTTGALLGSAAVRILGMSKAVMDDVTLSGFQQPAATGSFSDAAGVIARQESTCIPAAEALNASCPAGIAIASTRRVWINRLRAAQMRTMARTVGSGAALAIRGVPRSLGSDDTPNIFIDNCTVSDTTSFESGGAFMISIQEGGSDRSNNAVPRAYISLTGSTFARTSTIAGSGGAVAILRSPSQSDGFTLIFSTAASPVIFVDTYARLHGGGLFVSGAGTSEYGSEHALRGLLIAHSSSHLW